MLGTIVIDDELYENGKTVTVVVKLLLQVSVPKIELMVTV
jgi:hypothetical protein